MADLLSEAEIQKLEGIIAQRRVARIIALGFVACSLYALVIHGWPGFVLGLILAWIISKAPDAPPPELRAKALATADAINAEGRESNTAPRLHLGSVRQPRKVRGAKPPTSASR